MPERRVWETDAQYAARVNQGHHFKHPYLDAALAGLVALDAYNRHQQATEQRHQEQLDMIARTSGAASKVYMRCLECDHVQMVADANGVPHSPWSAQRISPDSVHRCDACGTPQTTICAIAYHSDPRLNLEFWETAEREELAKEQRLAATKRRRRRMWLAAVIAVTLATIIAAVALAQVRSARERADQAAAAAHRVRVEEHDSKLTAIDLPNKAAPGITESAWVSGVLSRNYEQMFSYVDCTAIGVDGHKIASGDRFHCVAYNPNPVRAFDIQALVSPEADIKVSLRQVGPTDFDPAH